MTDDPATPEEDGPRKRRPKDSEFFELPPDLKKKMAPGELPATASSSATGRKGDTRKAGESPAKKGGCLGLFVLLGAGIGALLVALA